MKLDDITIRFPDDYKIKDALRQGCEQNPDFLDITLKSYGLFLRMQKQELSISESIKSNENVSVFKHQILAAQKIKNELGGSAMLADEVGLGKTVEAGILIKEFLVTGLAKKVLILAPPSLLPQWQDEMYSKFDLDFVEYRDDSRFHSVAYDDLLLMSHSAAVFPTQSEKLGGVYWDLVVVDEAHSMKNADTLKHNLVRNLPKRNLLLLTATPIQNSLKDLYNLVDLLQPGYLGTWEQFSHAYATDSPRPTIRPGVRESLQRTMAKFIIRTTREEVRKYIKFTDRIPHTHVFAPSSQESRLYGALTDIVRDHYVKGGNTLALMIYQRLASSSTEAAKRALYKMKEGGMISNTVYGDLMSLANDIRQDTKLSNLLQTIYNQTSKFLIFTDFYATQDHIAECLQKNGYAVTLFNGKMNHSERRESIERFRGDDVRVMVSTSAGGEGQNFQFCPNVVNYDLPWNPMKVEQRVGRVHRIGQKDDVHIFNFTLAGTIEAYILELLYMKINLFKMALGDMDLLFEDSGAGLQHEWFKEYMTAGTEQERINRFSALGDAWKSRKEDINYAIHDFNSDVFKNFDLSSIRKGAQ